MQRNWGCLHAVCKSGEPCSLALLLYAIVYYSFINVTMITGSRTRGRQCDKAVAKRQAPSPLPLPSRLLQDPLRERHRRWQPPHHSLRKAQARTGAWAPWALSACPATAARASTNTGARLSPHLRLPNTEDAHTTNTNGGHPAVRGDRRYPSLIDPTTTSVSTAT